MTIIDSLRKRGVVCACGCGDELPRGDIVSKIDGRYYDLLHGKAYRLRVALARLVKVNANA